MVQITPRPGGELGRTKVRIDGYEYNVVESMEEIIRKINKGNDG